MKYIDMHCDTITSLYSSNGNLKENDLHIDLNKLLKGQCLLQNFAIFTDIKKHDSSFTYKCIDYYYKQLELNKDVIAPIYCYDDILKNEKDHKISAMLTLEEASVIDSDLNNLDKFYKLGVRMITLTWNYENGIAYPNFSYGKDYNTALYHINDKDGLTDFGIEVVKKMNELGIIVDVSHLSDKGFYDVLKYCDSPFVASHSDSREVCPVARNLSDDMIVKLAKKGGITGINYCSKFIEDKNSSNTTIDNIVKHIRYLVNKGGIDFVALGSDFDGIGNELEFKDASGMQKIYEALKPYFSETDIEKIFYKNVLRVYKQVLK